MVKILNQSQVECIVKAEAIVGESPLWSPHERVLYWVDISGQKIHRFNPRSAVNDTFHLPQPVTSVGLREKGGLIITLRKDFAFFDPETGDLKLLSDPEDDKPYDRFNDAKCDRQGRFWQGLWEIVKGTHRMEHSNSSILDTER